MSAAQTDGILDEAKTQGVSRWQKTQIAKIRAAFEQWDTNVISISITKQGAVEGIFSHPDNHYSFRFSLRPFTALCGEHFCEMRVQAVSVSGGAEFETLDLSSPRYGNGTLRIRGSGTFDYVRHNHLEAGDLAPNAIHAWTREAMEIAWGARKKIIELF